MLPAELLAGLGLARAFLAVFGDGGALGNGLGVLPAVLAALDGFALAARPVFGDGGALGGGLGVLPAELAAFKDLALARRSVLGLCHALRRRRERGHQADRRHCQ